MSLRGLFSERVYGVEVLVLVLEVFEQPLPRVASLIKKHRNVKSTTITFSFLNHKSSILMRLFKAIRVPNIVDEVQVKK